MFSTIMRPKMTYEEAVDWLFHQFPSYQNIGSKAYKPGLERIHHLLELFDHPQKGMQFVHVAGTNGKGSTCSMIASILTEAQLTVGLFTSPHIQDFRERICVNGKMINKNEVVECVQKVQGLILDKQLEIKPSFFEISFLMALLYFKQQKCQICIIETGLGGRLDATNCIHPLLSIITNVSLEHTNLLGNTIEAIAREKAGIIKENTSVIVGEEKKCTKVIYQQIAQEKNAPLIFVSNKIKIPKTFALNGDFQRKNARTALTAIEILQQHFFITDQHIKSGMQSPNLYNNTLLYGRLQLAESFPFVWIDVAHNPEGIKATLKHFQDVEELRMIYGSSADKELEQIFSLFPKNARYFFTEFSNERSASIEQLKALASRHQLNATFYLTVSDALKSAKMQTENIGKILIFGSFFLISDYKNQSDQGLESS